MKSFHNFLYYYKDELGGTCSAQWDVRIVCNILVVRSEGRDHFRNIVIDDMTISSRCVDVECIYFSPDMALVNTALNHLVP